MKTMIVYCLVSTDEDYYLELLLMSVYSLRLHNEGATIIVVTDSATYTTLTGKRAGIKEQVDDIVCVDTPDGYDKRLRSRYLKVNLRRFIKGDYVFLDTDTIVLGDLSALDTMDCDIAMALEANLNIPIGHSESKGDRWINEPVERLGWESLDGELHYNSGVVFAKDTDIVHRLYDSWHRNWLACTEAGFFRDEPALCKANRHKGHVICLMDDKYNWQIQRHESAIPEGTLVIHYFANDRNTSSFLLAKLNILDLVKENSYVNDFVAKYIKNINLAFPKLKLVVLISAKA